MKELDRLAASIAEQLSRSPRNVAWATDRIRNALILYEERIDQLAAKSEPKSPLGSFTDKGREEHRTRGLRTWTGYGFGCDVCGGGHDTETFMTLTIGWYKARLLIDLCLACAKRLSTVVDARLEDGRRAPRLARVLPQGDGRRGSRRPRGMAWD